jgi:2-polyprenyl-6-methoxyphenol hydroxylase-like FAD-dependent oxidoreductase
MNPLERVQDLVIYDVIISGAGPVGLFLACELALAKCSVLILEKAESAHSVLKELPFGIRGLSALSIEALSRRGFLTDLEIHKKIKNPHAHSVEGEKRQAGHFAGIPFVESKVDLAQFPYRLPSSTPLHLISEMAELEAALTRRARSLQVTMRRGFPVTHFMETENEICVHSNDRAFKGKWLVGCDGSRSVVRKLGGFAFTGTEPEFTGYTTQVEISDASMLGPGRNFTAHGMYMQSQPGYIVMQDFDGGEFHDSKSPITREHVQEVLRRISCSEVKIDELKIATTWTDRARQATQYRKNRILLAGDAAHIHSPLGGQGLNLGLGDAMNLGWKLAATIKGTAPDGLLDTYQAERHPLGIQILDWSRAQVAIMKPTPTSRALNAVFRDFMNTSDGATYVAGRVWGMFTRYDLGGGHPLIGQSVPNFEFEDGKTLHELMQDGYAIFLDFGNASSPKMPPIELGRPVHCISQRVKESFGLNALLVRPDGIVAWAI